jgi:hypothetical protein
MHLLPAHPHQDDSQRRDHRHGGKHPRDSRHLLTCYVASVFSLHQWRALYHWINSPLRRMGRLRDRLNRTNMTPDDPYVRAVSRAFDAVHEVSVRTYYFSVQSGVAGANEQRAMSDARLWCGDGI